MCGFSMGGVHASMVSSLFPGPVACVPLLAPRSAAAAFCKGALWEATAWKPLAAPLDEKEKVSDFFPLGRLAQSSHTEQRVLIRYTHVPFVFLYDTRVNICVPLSCVPSSIAFANFCICAFARSVHACALVPVCARVHSLIHFVTA